MSNSQTARIAAFPKAYVEELVDGSMSLFEWIEQAGTLEADGLEMYAGFIKSSDPSHLKEIKESAESQGLLIPMMCSSPDFTHPDETFRQNEIAKMKRMIDIMAVLGPDDFRSCRVLSGQKRPEVTREDGIKWTVESIQQLLPYAAEKQVHLVMENHYKDGYWIYPEFAQQSDVYLEIIEQISSPWFGVNYDPSNVIFAGEEPLELLEKVKHRIITMHASDRYLKDGYTLEDLRGYTHEGYSTALEHGVIGQGMNDYDAIFAQLRSVDFRGWISIEDGMNGLEDLRQSVQFLRKMTKEYLA